MHVWIYQEPYMEKYLYSRKSEILSIYTDIYTQLIYLLSNLWELKKVHDWILLVLQI